MAPGSDLFDCPGGCGERVHRLAATCQKCGFQSRLVQVENILGSLVTISSILTGFGLAAIVQLASVDKDNRDDWCIQGPMACWIVASLLLLGVIVGAELLRRRDLPSRIAPAQEEEDDLWLRSQWLLSAFAFSLMPIAAGVVWLGFFFSVWLGAIGVAAVLVAIFILSRSF